MDAIFQTGGGQHRVSPGQRLVVNRMPDYPVGSAVRFENVLMVRTETQVLVGAPFVAGAYVEASVESEQKGEKIIVFKKRRRKNYRRKAGAQALQTVLTITSVGMNA